MDKKYNVFREEDFKEAENLEKVDTTIMDPKVVMTTMVNGERGHTKYGMFRTPMTDHFDVLYRREFGIDLDKLDIFYSRNDVRVIGKFDTGRVFEAEATEDGWLIVEDK